MTWTDASSVRLLIFKAARPDQALSERASRIRPAQKPKGSRLGLKVLVVGIPWFRPASRRLG